MGKGGRCEGRKDGLGVDFLFLRGGGRERIERRNKDRLVVDFRVCGG